MAGSLSLYTTAGDLVIGPLAMGLTGAARGIDYQGQSFYAIDSTHLYKLQVQDGAVNIAGTPVDILGTAVRRGIGLKALVTDAGGHWIAIHEDTGTPPIAIETLTIHRFTLEGVHKGQLQNIQYDITLDGLVSFDFHDLAFDGMHLFTCWEQVVLLPGATVLNTIEKYLLADAQIVPPDVIFLSTADRINAMCFNGMGFHCLKRNNSAMTLYTKDFTKVVQRTAVVTTTPRKICFVGDEIDAFYSGGYYQEKEGFPVNKFGAQLVGYVI